MEDKIESESGSGDDIFSMVASRAAPPFFAGACGVDGHTKVADLPLVPAKEKKEEVIVNGWRKTTNAGIYPRPHPTFAPALDTLGSKSLNSMEMARHRI